MPTLALRISHARQAGLETMRTHRRTLITGVVLTSAGLTAVAVHRRAQLRSGLPSTPPRRFLHPLIVHAISGAVAETCERVAGHPLSTVRVKCQAHNLSTWTVLKELRGLGSKRAGLQSLYTGVGATAVGAALIGAVYLATFEGCSTHVSALQKAAAERIARMRRLIRARARTRMQQQQWLDTAQPSAGRDQPFAAHAGAREGDVQLQAASRRGSGSNGSGGTVHPHARHSVVTDLVSALVASVATSVIEGPLELFLNRARAASSGGGSISGAMRASFAAGGLAPLFSGYSAFLLKALPEDVAELVAYSQLAGLRSAPAPGEAGKGGLPALLRRLPDGVADMLLGGAAGATAVLMSMPLACIKTVLDTRGAPVPRGLLPTVAHFWHTGRCMVVAGGPGSLFRGLMPQLAETIPATMLYWVVVECIRRALAPYTLLPDSEASTCTAQ